MPQLKYNHEQEIEQPLLYHLIELRQRLVRSIIAIVVVFLPLFFIREQITDFLAIPIMKNLPDGSSLIAVEVASSFLIPVKVAFVSAFFIAQPYVLYQIWSFIAPGLYRHERNLALPLIISAAVLFYIGIAFSYLVVMPAAFWFFVQTAPSSVKMFTDIGHYYNFALKLFFAFGATFEIPVATFLLIRSGVVSPESLASKRPYIIVAAFVIAMLLTPPDPVSQFALALPMLALFELGLLAGKHFGKSPEAETDSDPNSETSDHLPTENIYEDPYHDDGEYQPMTDEEMEAELDMLDESEDNDSADDADEEDSGTDTKDK